MKFRIVFEDSKYYVEQKFLCFWIRIKKTVSHGDGSTTDFYIDFPTYDEALQCVNELIEREKSRKTKVICNEIEI